MFCKAKNPVDGLSVKDFIQLLNDTFSRNDFDAFSILVKIGMTLSRSQNPID
jgi:hypothetical protein